MILTYSGKSAISARRIAEAGDFQLNRGNIGDINWGRAQAHTKLNPDISNTTNKRVMREMFEEHGVPMPKLVPVHLAKQTVADGYQLVGRPDQHTQGRGFWFCRAPSDVVKALKGTRKKRPATHFMGYIEAPREYRVHIFLGKSIRISEKIFSAWHDYTTAKPRHEVAHVRKAAKQAVKALGLDFGAVDVLADDENAYVLEVNAAPGLGGSMPRLYSEIFTRWYEGDFDG